MTEKSTWTRIAEEAGWPTAILLKDADKARMDGFPYTWRYLRNLVTGRRPNALVGKVFRVGKHPAIMRADLVSWLDSKTETRR